MNQTLLEQHLIAVAMIKLFLSLVVVPVSTALALAHSTRIGLWSRKVLDSTFWHTRRPLAMAMVLLILPSASLWTLAGHVSGRGDLLFLAIGSSAFVATIIGWFLALSMSASRGQVWPTRLGLALVCGIASWLFNTAVSWIRLTG